MSRTYRKPDYYICYSDVAHINKELDYYFHRPYQSVWVKKTQEEYEHDLQCARKEYEKRIAENGGHTEYFVWSRLFKRYETRTIRERWVGRKRRVQIPYTREECIADALEERAEMQRDGHWSDTSRSSGFRNDCARALRRKNRRLCHNIIADQEYDHQPYPSRKEGKAKIWDWW